MEIHLFIHCCSHILISPWSDTNCCWYSVTLTILILLLRNCPFIHSFIIPIPLMTILTILFIVTFIDLVFLTALFIPFYICWKFYYPIDSIHSITFLVVTFIHSFIYSICYSLPTLLKRGIILIHSFIVIDILYLEAIYSLSPRTSWWSWYSFGIPLRWSFIHCDCCLVHSYLLFIDLQWWLFIDIVDDYSVFGIDHWYWYSVIGIIDIVLYCPLVLLFDIGIHSLMMPR